MAIPKDELIFGGVRVIQALPDGERPTAHQLYDGVLLPISYQNQSVHVAFERLSSAAEFLKYLTEIGMDVGKAGRKPILHIEAHGCKRGLVMPNGDLVPWAIMAELLTEINRLTKFNLLLVLGACSGAHFVETLLPTKPAPVWALIGPQENVIDSDLLDSYRVFYGELLNHFDGTKALQATMEGVPGGVRNFGLYTAAFVFRVAFQCLVTHATNSEAVRVRSERQVCKILAEHPELLQIFDECRATYFMFDKIPGNQKRFALTLADCIGSES